MTLNRKLFALAAVALLLCAGCGRKPLLDESRTFANDTWMRFEPEQFKVDVANTDDCFNFEVFVTVDTARYRESSIPLMLEVESPDHEKRTLFSPPSLRNYNGNCLGTFTDEGYLVGHQTVRDYYFFNTKGEHTLSLGQRTSKYEIKGIKELRLTIRKAELEYPK